jgi:hyperosmotically inducible periplasmic protein
MRTALRFIAIAAFALSLGASTIAFGETAGQYIDDATITTKVKAALVGHPKLKATQVSVETTNGVVDLSGTVDNKTQESEAVRLAKQVNGVKDVQDNLAVKNETQAQ